MVAAIRPTGAASARRDQAGLSLLELLIAAALASLVLGTLLNITLGGLRSQSVTRESNEMVYQARFALGLIVATARSTAPKRLSALPAASTTTGDWLSPVMYCLNGADQLIQTTPADASCAGSRVVADNVSTFRVERPGPLLGGQPDGPVDRPAAEITLGVRDASGKQSIEISATARLGGGSL